MDQKVKFKPYIIVKTILFYLGHRQRNLPMRRMGFVNLGTFIHFL